MTRIDPTHVALTVLATLSIAGCAHDAPSTTAHEPVSVTRQSCFVSEPAQWKAAIEASRIDTEGWLATGRAVAPGGEVLAVRDNGDTRDLILIGADASVRAVYAVPEPNTFDIGYAAIDEHWIVFALVYMPRGANGVLPTVTGIEIIDRADGSVRSVSATSAGTEPGAAGDPVVESVALHNGTVYWLTKDAFSSDTATVRSFDPTTAAITDVESGPMRHLRAGAGGVSWSPPGKGLDVLKIPAALPAALAGVAQADRVSLSTDGTAFGWIVDVDHGGTAVGYWSPESGAVTVSGLDLQIDRVVPPVFVYGSFVVVDKGLGAGFDVSGIVIDTRSGAVTGLETRPDALPDRAVAAADGRLVLDLWHGPDKLDLAVGVLDPDAWTPLQC